MAASVLHFLLFSSLFLSVKAIEPNSPVIKCNSNAPEIRSPFWVSGQQPKHYSHHGLPGFQLFCRENTTSIHFPAYGNLVVKSISYKLNKLDLLDPRNCVHEVFLNLNLSLTPFQYYYLVRNYTYLNCSTRLPPPLEEVPCLSGSRNHHVYTVDPSSNVPAFCLPVKTVAIPFAYSSYLSDSSFGLGLSWSLPINEKIVNLKEATVDVSQNQKSKQDVSI